MNFPKPINCVYKSRFKNCIFICGILFSFSLNAQSAEEIEKISLSGTIESLACSAACGVCCPTHSVLDTSGNLSLQIGNSFVDLSLISDDEQIHRFTGYYYETTGQCGVNQCTLFTVEEVDSEQISRPVFDSSNQILSIQSLVIDGAVDQAYSVTLSPPFNVDNATLLSDESQIEQGGDCSAQGSVCSTGTACLAYFGIAGAQGPEFKTCEIPCSHPGASCPLGQSCATIADGPGQVCTVD